MSRIALKALANASPSSQVSSLTTGRVNTPSHAERATFVPVGNPAASGGTESTSGGFKYHKFTSTGSLTVSTAGNFQVLIVAGGGGGGSNSASGGGGAGGIVYYSSIFLPVGSYTATIGAGGSAPVGGDYQGARGNFSHFGNLLQAIGGGPGGFNSQNGGSGGGGYGGGGMSEGALAVQVDQAGAIGYGNAGGGGQPGTAVWASSGGGAGAVGVYEGNGGAGTSDFSTWASATSSGSGGAYAGGGATGAVASNSSYTGGVGGGGNGGASGTAGTANTGGGGGGGRWDSMGLVAGKAGGSGIVIVRYAV
jgi:hypothetical protein